MKMLFALWWLVSITLFKCSPKPFYRWRNFLLRIFGAKIGSGSGIHPKVTIWFPWKLEIGKDTGIGFEVLIYNLDKISIGDRVTISQRVHLNTGSHNIYSPAFELLTKPIEIKSGVFIGTDTYVGLGVTVGEMAVIAARSVVIHDILPFSVNGGHPCKFIKERHIK